MAVRQYIGARYTIKIYENSLDPSSAEWESGFSYEPLTLVTFNNSSYLSKKSVPSNIGDPVSNSAYWVCTGYYNGQIMELQQEVAALQSDIYIISPTNDTSDRSAELATALTEHKAILFDKGTFYFAEGVTIPDDAKLFGLGMSSIIKMTTGRTGYIFNCGNNVTISDLFFDGGLESRPVDDSVNRIAIKAESKVYPIRITNCEFKGFDKAGIYVNDMGYASLSSVEVENCYFLVNGNGIYFDEHGEYGLIANCTFRNNHVGCRVDGGNNIFNNASIVGNDIGFLFDGTDISNNGHGSVNGCTINHNGIGLNLKNILYGYQIIGNLIIGNTTKDVVIDGSSGGISVNDNLFGAAIIDVVGSSQAFFRDNMIRGVATVNIESGSWVKGYGNVGVDGSRASGLNTSLDPFVASVMSKQYTTNASVTEAQFNQNTCVVKGGMAYFSFNMNVDVTPGTSFVEVGKFNLPANLVTGQYQMYESNDGGKFLIGIASNGVITIYSYNNGTGGVRFGLCIPVG